MRLMVILLRLIGLGESCLLLVLKRHGDIVTNPPQHMRPAFHKNNAEFFVYYLTAEPWSNRMAIAFRAIGK